MSTRSSSSSGIGVFGLLGTAFIFCKLAEVTAIAHWSWLWVLSPFWIGLAFALVVIMFAALAATMYD